tara:strand:- start:6710 stop:8926 length:2217 start_codon:yes stop_codon:yes gene_type:complete
MKKIIYAPLIIIGCYQYTQAQCFIEGSVSDNQVEIPFANIDVKEAKVGTSADAKGYFKLEAPAGNYSIEVSAMGYHKFKKKIQLIEGETFFIDPVLLKTSYSIDQVVVTGTLKESFVKVTPVKVEVITSAFLKKTPTNNIMEIIETVNGVQKQINCGVCGTSDIHINGMEGPYSLILIDGMPIMSSLSTVYGLNGIPTSLIKQIEIIKGPSSTLYGTEAVAGVINIITKSPEDLPNIQFEKFLSSDREKNIDISWSPKWKKTDMLLSANLFHMNNFMDKNGDEFADEVLSERISLFNKWSFHRVSGKSMDFTTKYYFEERFGGIENWSQEFKGSDSIYGEAITTNRWELSSHYELPSNENIVWQSSYNYHNQDSYYGDSQYKAIQNTLFNQLLWYKDIGLDHQLTTGMAYKFYSYNDNTPATEEIDFNHIPGIFIQDEFALSDQWKILSGIRWDRHQNHGNIFAPRLNIKWAPNENTTFRWNAGTGFRVVHLFTEDHAALTGSRDVVIANELQPEESMNINFNFNHWFQRIDQNTSLDLDLFYTHFSNKIVPDYDSDPSKIYYNNLSGYSVSKGASFQINQSFAIPLNMTIGGTYLNVYSIMNGEKNIELFAPSFSGVFSIAYEWPLKRIKVDYTGQVIGPMHLPKYAEEWSKEEISPWYTVQHLKVEKIISKKTSIYIAVRNMLNFTQGSPLIDPSEGSSSETNESWQIGFSPNFDTSYVYGPTRGRRYLIGVQWKW